MFAFWSSFVLLALNSAAKSDDEKRKLQDYMPQKRQHEELFSSEKRFKDEHDRSRRDKLKKLNEQLKETSHPHLPISVPKQTSAFTSVRWLFLFNFDRTPFSVSFLAHSERTNRANTAASPSRAWTVSRLPYAQRIRPSIVSRSFLIFIIVVFGGFSR